MSSMTPAPSIFFSFAFLFNSTNTPCNITSRFHDWTKKSARRTYSISELTTRINLSVFKVKLVSMHRPFSNWAGSLAISNHLPMNCGCKDNTEHCQRKRWINRHAWVDSVEKGFPTGGKWYIFSQLLYFITILTLTFHFMLFYTLHTFQRQCFFILNF